MRTIVHSPSIQAKKIDRTKQPTTEQSFDQRIVEHARLRFPVGTAAEWASRAGVTVRAAEHWLSGHRRLSGRAVGAIACAIFNPD